MRYKCNVCEGWIKDKFIFGLFHICLTDEEHLRKLDYQHRSMQQQYPSTLPSSLFPNIEELMNCEQAKFRRDNNI